MGWLSIFGGVMKFVNWLAARFERRELIDQGRREEMGHANARAMSRVRAAMAARRNVPKYLSGGLRDDPDRRD
jgi:hypothetical protein